MEKLTSPFPSRGTAIQPGDIIVGDADGVVIPQAKEQKVLEKSLEKLQRDEKREQNVSGNLEAIRGFLDTVLSNQ